MIPTCISDGNGRVIVSAQLPESALASPSNKIAVHDQSPNRARRRARSPSRSIANGLARRMCERPCKRQEHEAVVRREYHVIGMEDRAGGGFVEM